MDDWQLLQAYARDHSESAFAQLVQLHVDWIYSVALRHVGDPHLAEDVVQSVFVLLARKARDLRPGTLPAGWLFRTTCHVAAHARRTEVRRKIREATAHAMSHDTQSPDTDENLWQQLAPHLDRAVASLSEADRSAILLRFYQKMPLRELGEKLGVSEDSAKKRVSRALEKMRNFLNKRGVKLSGVTLMAVLTGKTVTTASAALAGGVVKVSMAAAATSSSAALPHLVRETLRAWRWSKIKLAAGLAVGSLAMIFVAVDGGHWLSRHSTAPTVTVNDSPQSDNTVPAAPQPANASLASGVSDQSQGRQKIDMITGLVVDEQGKPIGGAKVWSGYSSQPFAEDTTDSSGRFALEKNGAQWFVTVTAEGFAADQQEFNPTNSPIALIFRLGPVPSLKVRLVNESGEGVSGVSLFLQQWWGRPQTLGDYLPQKTDADGRLEWLSPPKGMLELSFGSEGYRYSRTNKFAADGQEHIIVLHPTATVTGSVMDAENGNAVPIFKFTLGQAQPWVPEDQIPLWDLSSHYSGSGTYKVRITEEPTPYLRIEADGYETVEAAIQLTNGVEVVHDFQLIRKNPAHAIRGRVLLPDGSPAAGVEVALCTTRVGVMISGTAFKRRAFGNMNGSEAPDYRRRTDEHGAFSFDSKPGAHTVVAVGPAGLGQVRCLDFSKPLEVRLQPWGRIEGNVHTRDGQWAERILEWLPTGHLTSWMAVDYDSKGFSARSDANGNFTLEHVPPGDGRIEMFNGAGTATILSASVQVDPGETARVRIGGVGRSVTGRLVAPPGVEIRSWPDQATIAQLANEVEPYSMPPNLTGNAAEQWKLEFEDTEAGRVWFRDQYVYNFKVGEDGSFTIPEVLPGKYRLVVNVAQGPLGSGTDTAILGHVETQIASGWRSLVVPEAPADGGAPVELGDIVLSATK